MGDRETEDAGAKDPFGGKGEGGYIHANFMPRLRWVKLRMKA